MIIFLTVGMHEQPLDRLVDLAGKLPASDIVVQYGFSKKPNIEGVRAYKFLEFKEMKALVNRSDVVITHGGTGSIMMALSAGKKPIVIPRLAQYGEHVDDHQLEIVSELARRGLILQYDETLIREQVRAASSSAQQFDSVAESEICKSIRQTLAID